MKKVGIWMDKEKAHVVTLSGQNEDFKTIFSDLEFYHPRGGSRTRSAKWGPQDVVQDSRYLEREKQQLKSYFKTVANAIQDVDALVLFGPADTNEKFRKELNDNYPSIGQRIRGVSKVDSMTDNQVKALIRDFFKKH